jgi:hypothetical protein
MHPSERLTAHVSCYSTSKIYSILVADDLTLVREALVALCQARTGYRVVAQCSEGTTALRLIQSEKPDTGTHPPLRSSAPRATQTRTVEEKISKEKASLVSPAGYGAHGITPV